MPRVVSFLLVLLLLILPGCARAQDKKVAAAGKPDAAQIEKYLRRTQGWPEQIKIDVGPFTPSPVQGLLQATVKLSLQDQHQDLNVLVSNDGQYLMLGQLQKLDGDPFASVRAKMNLTDAPSLGPALAPVTIVEYSDLQCPFCRGMGLELRQQVVPEFKGQVRLVFRDFPLLGIHPYAMPAAQLGRCVFKKYGDDAFWIYHDWAFTNQKELNAQNFQPKAMDFLKAKGQDPAQLQSCMATPEVKQQVEASLAEAQALGVDGTPTIFINGRKQVGAMQVDQLTKTIQTEVNFATGKEKP